MNNSLLSQSRHFSKEEKETFLLGMFNHYNGNTYIPTHPVLKNRLTFFLNDKESLIKVFKDTLLQYSLENNFKYEMRQSAFTELYKLEDDNPFGKYFIKKRFTNDFYYDEKDDQEYPLYFLYLNKKAFKEKNSQISFLLGAFINNGIVLSDDKYVFKSGNTAYINFVIVLLKKLNVKILKIEGPNESTLGGMRSVFFEPSGELKIMLKKNSNLGKN